MVGTFVHLIDIMSLRHKDLIYKVSNKPFDKKDQIAI